jgi:acetyl esterase/lipase
LGPILSRLLVVAFWVGLGLAVAGAVALERWQLKRREVATTPAALRLPELASAVERPAVDRPAAGRSREAVRLPIVQEPARGYTVEKDVSYGASNRLKLDVYVPTQPRSDGKTVVMVHGGGWSTGSKEDFAFLGQALASRGVTVVIPNYRLFPTARFPEFVEDCAWATRWAANRFGADKLFLMGHSSGAHIALMLAANTDYLAVAGVDRMKLRGVIGLSGAYDLSLQAPGLREISGGGANLNVQPAVFAKRPLPPVLLIHGTDDNTVDPANSEHLASAWRRAGGEVSLKLYSGVNHLDVALAMADVLPIKAPTRDDVLAFIEAH